MKKYVPKWYEKYLEIGDIICHTDIFRGRIVKVDGSIGGVVITEVKVLKSPYDKEVGEILVLQWIKGKSLKNWYVEDGNKIRSAIAQNYKI